MRLRVAVGLLVLGLGLGGLFGFFLPDQPAAMPNDPLVDDYVRVVSALYAHGEDLATVEGYLVGLGRGDPAQLVRDVAQRSGASNAVTNGDLAGLLLALAPVAEPAATPALRVAASGRGEGPTPSVRPDALVQTANTPAPEFPYRGRIAAGKSEASLRTRPTVSAPALRIVRQDTQFTVLGLEHAQAIEGAEDRWYQVQVNDQTGYIYFTLVEKVP